MEPKTDIKTTSSEIAVLWRTYMSDAMAICVLRYFQANVNDNDIRPLLDIALNTAKQHISFITDIFNKEGYPIPIGFNDEDVKVNAPPLFSNNFYLFYLRFMGSFALNTYSAALPTIARQDLLGFYTGCLNSSIDLTRKVTETMLSKGLFIRPPYIALPNKVDFVEEKDFLAGFFGERRNMIAGEIGEFHNNIQMNNTIKAILLGFSQVAKQEKVKNLLLRGRGISNKHIEIFSSKLKEEDIPPAMTWDTFVTDSTESPFSDKLLLYHTIAVTSAVFINYSVSMAASMRHDIQADYVRLLGENGLYGADCLNLMIENKWLEQPPQAINHDALIGIQ